MFNDLFPSDIGTHDSLFEKIAFDFFLSQNFTDFWTEDSSLQDLLAHTRCLRSGTKNLVETGTWLPEPLCGQPDIGFLSLQAVSAKLGLALSALLAHRTFESMTELASSLSSRENGLSVESLTSICFAFATQGHPYNTLTLRHANLVGAHLIPALWWISSQLPFTSSFMSEELQGPTDWHFNSPCHIYACNSEQMT